MQSLPLHLQVRQSLLLLVFTLPTPPSVISRRGVTVCVSRSRLWLCFPMPFLCLLLSSLVPLYFLVNSYNYNFHIYHYQLLSFATISTGKFLLPYWIIFLLFLWTTDAVNLTLQRGFFFKKLISMFLKVCFFPETWSTSKQFVPLEACLRVLVDRYRGVLPLPFY